MEQKSFYPFHSSLTAWQRSETKTTIKVACGLLMKRTIKTKCNTKNKKERNEERVTYDLFCNIAASIEALRSAIIVLTY